jgi:hypothetical protein
VVVYVLVGRATSTIAVAVAPLVFGAVTAAGAGVAYFHARAQLRRAGIRPPADHEALLAAYLELLKTADPEVFACERGKPPPTANRPGPPRKYIDETHRKRAHRSTHASLAGGW